MTRKFPDVDCLKVLWGKFFPQDGDLSGLREEYYYQHERYGAIKIFMEFFIGQCSCSTKDSVDDHSCLLRGSKVNQPDEINVELDVSFVEKIFPVDDFISTLTSDPEDVIGCLSIAASIVLWQFSNDSLGNLIRPLPVFVRIYQLPHVYSSFADLKANACGRLVMLRGHVIRVSACNPLIDKGVFRCTTCGTLNSKQFLDGIFSPPTKCSKDDCRSKYFEFQRDLTEFQDYQRIKLQELEDSDQTSQSDSNWAGQDSLCGRAPRSFEVELRGSYLLDKCIAGDVVEVVGVLKAIQAEMGYARRSNGSKGGALESGLHQLYVLANSLTQQAKYCQPSRAVISDSRFEGKARKDLHDQNQSKKRKFDGDLRGSDNIPSFGDGSFSRQHLHAIQSLALNPQCLALLISGFCPSIFGHELVKMGLLLGLVGAPSDQDVDKSKSLVPMQPKSKGIDCTSESKYEELITLSRTRSDVHVLIVGDPGLGKSQMLRAAAKIAPRSVFVTGNTASTAGLTVSLVKEPGTGGETSIEAGALVLADRGVCCIDEFDKMASGGGGGSKGYGSRGKGSGCDPHSLLEAMEQQSVSVAKSGIVLSLRCRTTVFAAANPVGGHYDRRKSVSENLKLASALLSRFDLVFIMLDRPDQERDRMISEHVMKMNSSSSARQSTAPEDMESDSLMTLTQRLRKSVRQASDCSVERTHESQPTLLTAAELRHEMDRSPDLLRQYVAYARSYCHPTLSIPAAKVLQRHYLKMRSEAHSSSDGVAVTTRHLESLIRLAQARARLELREVVSESDARDVVDLFSECMLDAVTLDSGQIDFGRKGGMSMAKQVKALVAVLHKKSALSGSNVFTRNDIADAAALLKLKDAANIDRLIEVMRNECYLLLKGPRLYQLSS